MTQTNAARRQGTLGLILLAFVAFIALGLPDGLLGVGWPSIRAGFAIPLDSLGFLLAASVSGYMLSSFVSGWLLTTLGVGRMLAASCLITGLALAGYTLVPHWWMMVILGVFAGLGGGAIDAGLNTYVATHFSETLMQWLHASWGVGVTLGPLIMTFGLSAFHSWRFGYLVVAGFQILLALSFLLTLPIWNRSKSQTTTGSSAEEPPRLTDYRTPLAETLRQPQVWLSMLLFFFYVSGEIGLGTWTYTLLTESRGIPETVAGLFAGSYWFTFTIGRIVAGMVVTRIGFHKLVIGGTLGALLGTLLLIWNPFPAANVVAVSIIGLAIAPIFPALISGTPSRVGERFAANTIGMQITATGLGAAVIPALMGVFARHISLEVIPLILLAVYLTLLLLYLLATRSPKAASPVAAR